MKGYYKYLIAVGVITGAYLLISWRRKAANAAADFLDIEEIGNNQGWSNRLFQEMMRSVGWKSGEAWCMYFVKAVYMNAFPKRADKIKAVLTGSTQGSWEAAKQSDIFKVITDGPARPGDIAIWKSIKNPSLGHAGIVWRKENRDNGITIEGNTSLDGAREGQGVVKGERVLIPGTIEGSLKLLGFIRIKL